MYDFVEFFAGAKAVTLAMREASTIDSLIVCMYMLRFASISAVFFAR